MEVTEELKRAVNSRLYEAFGSTIPGEATEHLIRGILTDISKVEYTNKLQCVRLAATCYPHDNIIEGAEKIYKFVNNIK